MEIERIISRVFTDFPAVSRGLFHRRDERVKFAEATAKEMTAKACVENRRLNKKLFNKYLAKSVFACSRKKQDL